ncbi:cytochrome P450 [Imleria badia]|nr:cytochrome P450 [Imleria badia]
MLGKDILVINSDKVAKDLLENRSTNYSDRPYLILNEKCGVDFSSAFMPYGDRWRLHRRFFHQTFRPEAVPRFLPYQHRRVCQLLRQMFNAPEQLENHIFEYGAAVIMNSTYDYDPASREDELVGIQASMLKIVLHILRPDRGALVGAFPWVLHLPSWFPGMEFKNDIAKARMYAKLAVERPFEYSLQKVTSGSGAPSMVYDGLQQMEEKGIPNDESWTKELKEACGTAFGAASDSTRSVLMTFFLMMVVNPAVQERAQAHIDAVVGKDRLPTIEDRPSLPFIDAVLRETLRYNPVTPLSFPHIASEDDVYNGFHIPKGAMLLTNVWSMAYDESRFPNSRAFVPERHLNDDDSLKPNEVENIAFGFGRRMCPGRHFADTSVWLVIVKVLAVFKILRPLDENGVEIPVEPKFTSGISTHPAPFGYRIVPRIPGTDAEKLEQLIADGTP